MNSEDLFFKSGDLSRNYPFSYFLWSFTFPKSKDYYPVITQTTMQTDIGLLYNNINLRSGTFSTFPTSKLWLIYILVCTLYESERTLTTAPPLPAINDVVVFILEQGTLHVGRITWGNIRLWKRNRKTQTVSEGDKSKIQREHSQWTHHIKYLFFIFRFIYVDTTISFIAFSVRHTHP